VMSVVPGARQHRSTPSSVEGATPDGYFFEQISVIPLDGVGHDAVQMPPLWMLGCNVVPSFDRQVAAAMISPAPHSEVHPIEPQLLLPTDLT
jgi:hypothetical protein